MHAADRGGEHFRDVLQQAQLVFRDLGVYLAYADSADLFVAVIDAGGQKRRDRFGVNELWAVAPAA
jgi:hypothetical protein